MWRNKFKKSIRFGLEKCHGNKFILYNLS